MIITIDGKKCTCEKGEFLLQIAKRNGIHIPTLCHHESLPGQGCCRLCIAEVLERGKSKVVVSCVYPVEKEIEVYTDSEKIRKERGIVLALLKKRAPDSDVIDELCRQYHAPELVRLKPADTGKCILCGLCVRACTELSVGAISTVNRGILKEIAPPYHEPSSVCVGCGSCASVCPTDAIEIEETDTHRTIWGKTFELVHCSRCGKPIGTKEELELSAARAGLEPVMLCENCKKIRAADVFAHTYGE